MHNRKYDPRMFHKQLPPLRKKIELPSLSESKIIIQKPRHTRTPSPMPQELNFSPQPPRNMTSNQNQKEEKYKPSNLPEIKIMRKTISFSKLPPLETIIEEKPEDLSGRITLPPMRK